MRIAARITAASACAVFVSLGVPARAQTCHFGPPTPTIGTTHVSYFGRLYILSVPPQCTSAGCGLIVDLHGSSMSADDEDQLTHLRALAQSAARSSPPTRNVVLQPQAPHHPAEWDAADPAIIYGAIDCATKALHLDRSQWHIGGYSLGAFVAARIACDHPHDFASIGLIAGGADTLVSCINALPPTLYIHGHGDYIVPFASAERLASAAAQVAGSRGHIDAIDRERTLYRTETLTLETIFHSAAGALVGAHCVPGGLGPAACTGGPNAGEELLQFYSAHSAR
jgi:poly(3-hydroxybutyrate) depolymerase